MAEAMTVAELATEDLIVQNNSPNPVFPIVSVRTVVSPSPSVTLNETGRTKMFGGKSACAYT